MAKTVATNKPARASKKKLGTETTQTHGALEPRPMPNMIQMFGIDDGYRGADTIEQYRQKLDGMVTGDLREHAHKVGIVPVDSREKLIESLERKYLQAKAAQRPTRQSTVPMNPKMADWHKKWWNGDLNT